MMAYEAERQAFMQLKNAMDTHYELRKDVEFAIAQTLNRFATSIRENRFVVGGVVEAIVAAALRAAGIEAQDVGAYDERIDIRIPDGGFSIKGRFKSGDIRLINVLGESRDAAWETPTIFVLYGVGVAYADPELIDRNETRRVSDAIVLRYRALKEFLIKSPDYLIRCEIPEAREDVQGSEVASRALAKQILSETLMLRQHTE